MIINQTHFEKIIKIGQYIDVHAYTLTSTGWDRKF